MLFGAELACSWAARKSCSCSTTVSRKDQRPADKTPMSKGGSIFEAPRSYAHTPTQTASWSTETMMVEFYGNTDTNYEVS
jgi:hypothetical protein